MSFNLTFVWGSLMGDSNLTSKIFSKEQNMNSTWSNTTDATNVANFTKTTNKSSWWTGQVEQLKYGNSFKV